MYVKCAATVYLSTTVKGDVFGVLDGSVYVDVNSVYNRLIRQASVPSLVHSQVEGQIDFRTLQIHFLCRSDMNSARPVANHVAKEEVRVVTDDAQLRATVHLKLVEVEQVSV